MSRALRFSRTTTGLVALLLLTALLSLPATAQDATPPGAATPATLWPPQDLLPPAELDVAGQTAAINGVDIYYEIYGGGNGDPVILLHDALANGDHFVTQIPALARDHEVIVMDSRGHGRSTFSATPFSYSVMAEDVLALMDHLGIEQASLAGVGDGGVIALDLALTHPERLNRAVAFGARFSPGEVWSDAGDNPYVSAYIARAAEEYQQISPAPARWEEFQRSLMTMWDLEPNFTEEQLQGITTPFLILAGADEEVIDLDRTRRLAELIPDAELVLMPGTGHFALFEQPEEFSGLVVDFLDG